MYVLHKCRKCYNKWILMTFLIISKIWLNNFCGQKDHYLKWLFWNFKTGLSLIQRRKRFLKMLTNKHSRMIHTGKIRPNCKITFYYNVFFCNELGSKRRFVWYSYRHVWKKWRKKDIFLLTVFFSTKSRTNYDFSDKWFM